LLSKPSSKPIVSSGHKPQQAAKPSGGNFESKAHGSEASKPGQVKCFNCGGPHIVRFCDKKRNFTDRPNTNGVSRVAQKSQGALSDDATVVNKQYDVSRNKNIFTATAVIN